MSNVGIFFCIFGFCILLAGIYMFTGHKIGLLEGRAAFQHLTKEQWKKIGTGTMIASIIPFVIAILAFIFHWE